MENKLNDKKNFGLIAAIIFIILAVYNVISLLSTLIEGYGYLSDIFWVIEIAAYILVAVGLIKKDNPNLFIIGFGLYGLQNLFYFFRGFTWDSYSIITDYYYYSDEYKFNFFCMLPSLLFLVAGAGMIAMAVIIFTPKFPQYRDTVKKLWYLPGTLMGVGLVISVIILVAYSGTSSYWNGYYGYVGGYYGFLNIATAVAFIFTGMVMVNYPMYAKCNYSGGMNMKEEFKENYSTEDNYSVGVATVKPEGYCDIALHVVLLLFTFGIWFYIWLYRTTRFLNRVQGHEFRNPTNQLLLSLFVPFYFIYWIYKSAQRIDTYARQNGVQSDITTISLVFAIFLFIISPVIMQDKINTVLKKKHGIVEESLGGGAEPAVHYEEPVSEGYVEKNVKTSEKPSGARTIADEIRVYKDLLDQGLITEEEFAAKKNQLLGI